MDELLSAGYAFQVETTQLADLAGARIEAVPFAFSERVAGASKMTLRISLEGFASRSRCAGITARHAATDRSRRCSLRRARARSSAG